MSIRGAKPKCGRKKNPTCNTGRSFHNFKSTEEKIINKIDRGIRRGKSFFEDDDRIIMPTKITPDGNRIWTFN